MKKKILNYSTNFFFHFEFSFLYSITSLDFNSVFLDSGKINWKFFMSFKSRLEGFYYIFLENKKFEKEKTPKIDKLCRIGRGDSYTHKYKVPSNFQWSKRIMRCI